MLSWYAQILVNGFGTGMLYLLIVLGFTLIYGVMRVVNFAHGHLYMLGAMFAHILTVSLGMNFWLGLVASAVLVGLLGIILERLVFHPLLDNHIASAVSAIGVFVFIGGVTEALMGGHVRGVESPWKGAVNIGDVIISGDRFIMIIASLIVVTAFFVLMKFTKVGRATRAVVDDTEMATVQGVNPATIYIVNFAVAAACAGFAGALVSPVMGAAPDMAFPALNRAFIIVVLGGVGSIPGAIVAALFLGFFDSTVTTLISSQVAEMGAFVMVGILLVFRPLGLFGKA
jgi:branched-chain amino acid transport system permease protein